MTTSDPSEPESARQNSGDETAGVDDISNQEPGVTEANSADDKSRNRLGRAAVATLIGLVLVGLLQWNASETDHQFSNMATVLLVFLIGGYVLFQIHCLTRMRWNSFVVPGAGLLVIAGFIGMWEFEGFSGELVPQFSFRFGNTRPAMQSVESDAGPENDRGGVPGNEEKDSSVALAAYGGFLGDERTAVIAERHFDVPASVDEVKVLWRQGLGDGWAAFAVSGDKAVTLEQRDEEECLTCYRLGDGALLWMIKHQTRHENLMGGVGPRSTPTIVGNRVFAQGATGVLWCVDLPTGELVWSIDLVEQAGWSQAESEAMISWGRAASPLIIDDGICVVPFGGPEQNREPGRSLIALDVSSGKVLWTAGEDQISYASPVLLNLGGKRQIVSVNESTITGHDIDDGSVLWKTSWPGQSNGGANCASVVPVGDSRFLIGKGYGGGSALYEVKQSDGQWIVDEIWKSNRVLKTKFTHAAVKGEVAFGISNGALEAVRLEDGERQWIQSRRSRLGQGQIVVVDDVIVGQAENGEVVLVAADSEDYRELLRMPALNTKTWNVPSIAGRHLLVRNDREVICFLLPGLDRESAVDADRQ